MVKREGEHARRIVVKVGSSSISGQNHGQIDPLVDHLATLHRDFQVVLVTSGAIATGLPFVGLQERPTDLALQQAVAAVGQHALIVRYQRALDRHAITAGQVLLTSYDMDDPVSRKNAQRALDMLMDLDTLPIVNENDTVATQEIHFGDNDRLAALVARLINAERLVLLSDIESLRTAPPDQPGSEPIDEVAYGESLAGVEFGTSSSKVGSGGARTKVEAARLAAEAGIEVFVTATPRFGDLLQGAQVGTRFAPNPSPAQ